LNIQYEIVNDSEVVEIDEDDDAQIMKEDEDGVAPAGSKRKLTSIVWNEFRSSSKRCSQGKNVCTVSSIYLEQQVMDLNIFMTI
jgi:hypothetical protein